MTKDTNLKGILLMIASMAAFAAAATLVKLSTSVISPSQVLFLLISGALVIMALAKIPISVVGAGTQATPLLATVGAVLFLKEKVGWRRWCSTVIGFVGVLLIVRPGAIEFDYQVLWAILPLVSLSVRDLTTRLVPADMASTSLATYTMAAALPFTIGWVYFNGYNLLPAQINC